MMRAHVSDPRAAETGRPDATLGGSLALDRPRALTPGRRNVLLLALCQAAFMSSAALVATVGSLAGHALAADKSLATLPATAVVVGTALGTIPASLLMRRVGRQRGFIAGTGFAVAGGLVGAAAIGAGSFWLLALGCVLVGLSSAFGQLYRFAAAEAVPESERSRAIAVVLAGGLVAGFVGPQLARATANLSATPYVASFLAVPGLALVTILLLVGLRLRRWRPRGRRWDRPGRSRSSCGSRASWRRSSAR